MRALRWLPLLLAAALLDVGIAGEALGRFAAGRAPAPSARLATTPRFVFLGFDGVDPRILAEYLDDLPAIRRLVEQGGLHHLQSETPPESPVAWASLLTGVGPGRHSIFDFVVRDPAESGYAPVNGMVRLRPARWILSTVPWRPVQVERRLAAPTFLETVREAGFPVLGVRIPLLFPSPDAPGAAILSGLGTPDVAGSNGLYTVYRTGFGLGAAETEFGGRNVRLEGGDEARTFDTALAGPYDRRRRVGSGGHARIEVPVRFERDDHAVTVTLQGRSERIAVGARGSWLPVRFPFPGSFPRVDVAGRVRFEVKSARPRLVVLASPVQIDPDRPALPLTSPGDLSRELERRYGPYKTQGWMEETFQLNDGNTTEEAFLADCLEDMDQTAAMLLGEMRRGGARLVAGVFTQTDRATHCFYRLRDKDHPAHDAALAARVGDPLREVYRRMDRIVASVVAALAPDDVLLVASDHGFQSWRRGMNVNAWLEKEGFLASRGSPEMTLDGFFGGSVDGGHVDWARTRAYAMGLGQIYVNRRGREPAGIVEDADVPALLGEIRRKMKDYVDPETGERPVRDVLFLHDLYEGPYAKEAAELQLAFGPGYRISWQTALLGGIGRPVVEPNLYPWSGDHCSTDRDLVPGVLLSNRAIPKAAEGSPYGLRDVAASVFAHFGLDLSALEGRPIPLGPAPTK